MSTPHPRYLTLLKALEAERSNELAYFKNINDNKSNKQKIDLGVLWYPVEISRKSYGNGDFIEIEIKKLKHLDTSHQFKEGVAATFFNVQDARKDLKASILSVRRDKIRLLVDADKFNDCDQFEKGLSGIELIYDDRPYRVMQYALNDIIKTNYEPHVLLREAVNTQLMSAEAHDTSWTDHHLDYRTDINESQRNAIKSALAAPSMGIIHGPPGTGKTTTLVALAETLLKQEKQILVCAPSNTAVDILAERLSKKGLSVLRIGNVSRIDDDIMHLTLDQKLRDHAEWQQIKKVRILAQEADRSANAFKRSFGPEERHERKIFKQEARELKKWAFELEERLTEEILHSTQIIAATLIGVSQHTLKSIKFKTVFIDEASQCAEAECWNAILKADRVILAGDHMQLPPTIKSTEAKALGMDITLLDRMKDVILHASLLKVQYRMNDKILGFSNKEFYNDQLLSDISVANHHLLNDSTPLCFIDTAGCGFEEVSNSENKSLSNPGEYSIVLNHLLMHIDDYANVSIGIISPYAEQVRFIQQQINEDSRLKHLDIEVNSIDGFQGQEKELIYISLVRSNERSELGFLKDQRRLNVAMTRAQKKLVIVGDSGTLVTFKLFEDLVNYVESKGYYQSAWEYLST
jgi:superfamily I DNA and/or RNA helicase